MLLGECQQDAVRGDINGDSALSVADVVLLQKWILAVPNTILPNWKAADLCEDDKLNVFDLCMMKRYFIYGWDNPVLKVLADMNGDNQVTVADIVWLQKWLLGIPKP